MYGKRFGGLRQRDDGSFEKEEKLYRDVAVVWVEPDVDDMFDVIILYAKEQKMRVYKYTCTLISNFYDSATLSTIEC